MRKHSITFKDSYRITKQSFKDECDINKIMLKFQKTGAINHYNNRAAEYGDATPLALHAAMNIVVNTETMFLELPSSIRKKFHNDPEEFLEFVQDPKNLEEMKELGLTKAPSVSDNKPDETPPKSAPAPKEPKTSPEPKGE